jgi:hypothetical protein
VTAALIDGEVRERDACRLVVTTFADGMLAR